MSRLSELIAELCPDGVEYRALGEVAELVRGSGLQKKDFSETGVGCIHYGQIHTKFGSYTDQVLSYVPEELAKKLTVIHPGDVVVAVTSEDVSACCKAVAWIGDVDVVTGGHCVVMRHDLDSKYLSYCFQTSEFYVQKKRFAAGVKVTEMRTDKLARIRIPVPPIEVQREVVRILDEYTAAHDELIRRLCEEMRLCEQQLAMTRNKLLTFSERERVKWMALADVATFGGGHTPSKAIAANYEEGGVWWVTSKDVKTDVLTSTGVTISELGASTLTLYPRGTLVMVTRSGVLKRMLPVAFLDDAMTVNQDIKVIMPDETTMLSRFLFHVLRNDDATIRKRYGKVGGTVDSVNFNMVKKHQVPVPSIDIQQSIVEQLDTLVSFNNKLVKALVGDLESHAKQLTLVRNHLLSFPEKGA